MYHIVKLRRSQADKHQETSRSCTKGFSCSLPNQTLAKFVGSMENIVSGMFVLIIGSRKPFMTPLPPPRRFPSCSMFNCSVAKRVCSALFVTVTCDDEACGFRAPHFHVRHRSSSGLLGLFSRWVQHNSRTQEYSTRRFKLNLVQDGSCCFGCVCVVGGLSMVGHGKPTGSQVSAL